MSLEDVITGVDLSSTDLSNQAFSMLFGQEWWNVAGRSADIATGPLLPMLGTVNSLLLLGVGAMAIYQIILAATGTASGTLGGSLNNFWWPLRVGFGFSMTAPLIKGLSAFQIILLACVGWSSTLANTLYDTVIANLAESKFTITSAAPPPHMRMEGQDIAQTLLNGIVTQVYMNEMIKDLAKAQQDNESSTVVPTWKYTKIFTTTYSEPSSTAAAMGEEDPEENGKYVLRFTVPPNEGLADDALGGFDVPGIKGQYIPVAKVNAINMMCSVVGPIALKIVNGTYDPKTDEGWLADAITVYNNTMLNAFSKLNANYKDAGLDKDIASFKKEAKSLGWFAAGAFHLKIISLRQKAMEQVYTPVKLIPMDTTSVTLFAEGTEYNEYTGKMAAAEKSFGNEPNPSKPGKSIKDTFKDGDYTEWVQDILYVFSGRIAVQHLLTRLETEDPVLVFADYGHIALDAGMAIWAGGLGYAAGLAGGWGWCQSLAGKIVGAVTVGATNAAVGAAEGGWRYIAAWLRLLLAGMFIVAVVFAYIFPSMPVIYWSLAMCGFMLLVVEMMVAAPFWAAAHAWSSKDEGFAGELGKRGYLQFLEIFFRPPLYIIGFFVILTTMQAMSFVIARLVETFFNAYASSGISWTMGWVTNFSMAIIIGSMYVYMFHFLCTEGYSNLPRKVIRWIGGDGNTLGAAEHSKKMHNTMVGGVQKAGEGNLALPKQGLGKGKEKSTGSSEGTPKNMPGAVSVGNKVMRKAGIKKP